MTNILDQILVNFWVKPVSRVDFVFLLKQQEQPPQNVGLTLAQQGLFILVITDLLKKLKHSTIGYSKTF